MRLYRYFMYIIQEGSVDPRSSSTSTKQATSSHTSLNITRLLAMVPQMIQRGFLAATILAVTAVQASPFQSLDARDVFVDPATCDPLVYGATAIPMGQVCVGILDGTLSIVYTVNAGWSVNTVHALVGTTVPTITAPGQMTYSSDKGSPPACTLASNNLTSTCTIPVQSAWRGCNKKLYIVTHASVTGPGTTGGETAWGKGTCYDSKGNCAKYWTFTEQCFCKLQIDFFPITYTVGPLSHSRPLQWFIH